MQMNQKLVECFSHPVKCRLLLEVYACGQATAGYLAKRYPDISQATLYRQLKRMTADGVLKIVQESQVRGAVEKTYGLALDSKRDYAMLEQNSGPAYLQLFLDYMLTFTRQFQAYCASSGMDLREDRSGFSMASVYATDEELDAATEELSKILAPLAQNTEAEGRKRRTLGVILGPPEASE